MCLYHMSLKLGRVSPVSNETPIEITLKCFLASQKINELASQKGIRTTAK